jgi:hypothetical protein
VQGFLSGAPGTAALAFEQATAVREELMVYLFAGLPPVSDRLPGTACGHHGPPGYPAGRYRLMSIIDLARQHAKMSVAELWLGD